MSGVKARPAAERWATKVERTDHCWEWTGAKQAGGYGRFLGDNGRLVLAHRWSYEHHVGPIPGDLTIDHLCRNTSCVNPAHLEVVTREENAYRGNTNKSKVRCIRGHDLSGANVYTPPSRPNVRMCRACRSAAAASRKKAS